MAGLGPVVAIAGQNPPPTQPKSKPAQLDTASRVQAKLDQAHDPERKPVVKRPHVIKIEDDEPPPPPKRLKETPYKDENFPQLILHKRDDGSVSPSTLKLLMAATSIKARCPAPACHCYAHAELLITVRAS